MNKKALQNVADATSKSPVAMNALSSVGNTLANTGYGIGSTLNWLTGNPDYTDNFEFGVEANQAIRGTTKDMIGEDKKVANTLYDVGMGVADFGGALALGGGNPLMARAFQTSSAVGGSAYDAKSRGLTDSQAMAEGLVGGAAELALSKLPFDTLTRTNADDALLKTLFKQGLSEALEEGGTSAVNAIADSIIAGNNSSFNLKKQEYMLQGMSESEAESKALQDVLKEVGYEGLIGGLSGSAIGGINLGTQKVASKYANANNQLEPLAETTSNVVAETATEPTAKRTQMPLEPLSAQQTTNAMSNNESALNSQIQGGIEKSNIDTLTETIYNNSVNSDGLLNRSGLNGENINSRTGIEGISGKRTESGHQYSGEVEKSRENSGRNTGFSQELVVTSESNKAKLNEKGITSNEFRSTKNNPELFSFALDTARSANKKGAMVSARSASELAKGNINTFLSPDGLVGGAVEENGNITAVFKNPKSKSKGAVADIILTAIQNGGTKLDCYGEFLLDSYSRLGFEPVAKVKFVREFADPDWNYDELGEPDIYFMKHNGKSIDEVVDDYVNGNAVVYSQEYIDSLPYMEYEEAEAYRDSLISNEKTASVQSANSIVPDLANAETLNQYADVSNIEGDNQRIRSYNETVINKTDAPEVIKNDLIDNPEIYNQLSNKATLDKAVEILNNNDTNTAIVEFKKYLDATNPIAVPLGYNLSKQLVAENRVDEAIQIVRDIEKALTRSGQFSQSAVITMLNNSPEAAMRYLVREIDNLNKKGAEKFGKKWENFELTESEVKRFGEIENGDTEAIKALYQDVYNRIKKQYPSDVKEKLMEFRRVAMLLNVRTNIRNVVSNALLFPVRWTADRVASLGEGAYSLINPNYKRTQSLNPIRSKKSRQLASEIFEAKKDVLLNENKYDDASGAMRNKQVFKGTKASKVLDVIFNGAITKANNAMGKDVNPSLMETARNLTYYLLEKGDNIFVKQNFVSRLSSYLDAQGITDIADVPPEAIQLATQEAMKATFKDDSSFAKGLTQFRKMLNKAPGGVLGDIVMPFTKTPANLAMRGIDYSPVGLTNAFKTLKNAKTNDEVAKGITQLAQSVTGTAAIALGYVLAESGIIKGALSDDKDEAQFEKQQGQLAYSIKTPWGYFSYDWAQPASIPLILGATIYDSLNDNVSLLGGLKQGGLAVADSWLELSPLQNMSEIFGGYGTPAENVLDVLATDFPLSFIPSQLGAIARSVDTTQRTSYSNNYLDNLKNQAMAKIPGLSDNLSATYDTWGNEVKRADNIWEGLTANLINPGQFGNENVTAIDDDITALYDATGSNSVFPRKADWSYKVDGENIKLTSEQYSEMQRIMGSNAYDMAESFITSGYYNAMSDESKVDVIENLYNFSVALAKNEVLGYDVETNDTYKKAYEVYQKEGAEGVAQYYAIKKLAGADAKQSDYLKTVNNMNLTDEEKGFYLRTLDSSNSEKLSAIETAYGLDGLYDWYIIKDNTEKETNAGKVKAINEMDLSDKEKGYYLSLYISSISKEAQSILDEYGYEAFYQYYFEKTAEDRKNLK
jgi:hypothetical protein